MITALGQLPCAWHIILAVRKYNGLGARLEPARHTQKPNHKRSVMNRLQAKTVSTGILAGGKPASIQCCKGGVQQAADLLKDAY